MTFLCKYIECEHYKSKRKAFRSATTANRHMQIQHKPTDAEWEELAYADGADEHVVHEQPPKRGPASKKKPKRKKKAAHSEDPSDGTSAVSYTHLTLPTN